MIGKDTIKELRELADWFESPEGQARFEDQGTDDRGTVTAAVVQLLNFAQDKGWRTDYIHVYGWLRHFFNTPSDERDYEYHQAFWKTVEPLVDRDDGEIELGKRKIDHEPT